VRIVLAADGTRGDVYPLCALGEAWQARGHDVVMCGPPDFEASFAGSEIEYRAVGRNVREFLTEAAAAVAGKPIATLVEMTRYLGEVLRLQLEAVPRVAAGADLVIGAGVQAGAAAAAEIHGIPYRYIAYCPVMFPSAHYAPAVVPWSGLPRWLNRLAWLVFHPPFVGMVRSQLNRQRRALGLPPVRDAYAHLMSERPLLAADSALGWVGSDCPYDVQQIRCLHPIDRSPLPEKLRSFLDAGPAPIFVGFGSMTDPDPAATTRSVLGAIARTGCRAVISEGWAGLGDGPLPECVFVTGSVSHDALFRRCALVVHHGGAGTTTSAARAGVPQLLLPHLLDQFYWSGQVHALGLGPPALNRGKLAAAPLAERISEAVGNELLLERARELATTLAELGPTAPALDAIL